MKKIIKLTESDLRRIIQRVISEQSRRGNDPDVLQAISSMNFKVDACANKDKGTDINLSHEFCNTTFPNIMISYTDDGLELLDLKKQKIIKVWEGFSDENIPELEQAVKSATI